MRYKTEHYFRWMPLQRNFVCARYGFTIQSASLNHHAIDLNIVVYGFLNREHYGYLTKIYIRIMFKKWKSMSFKFHLFKHI